MPSIPTLTKQPSENRLYSMEFAPNLEAGEVIDSVVSCVAEPAGLTLVGAPEASGTKASQRISGGAPGVNYKVTFVVTTSALNTLEAEGYLRVVAV